MWRLMSSNSPAKLPRASGAQRTSTLLLEFAHSFPHERVRLRDLGALLGARSFGFFLLVLALPNAVPIGIPGTSAITGVPMTLIALQMMLGLPEPYLPAWLADRSLPRDVFRRLVLKTAPWLQRIERIMRPRWTGLTDRRGERVLGGICLLLGIVLCLPIPLGNLLPAVGVVLLALGVLERDGLLVGIGLTVGAAGVALASGVVWGMLEAAYYFIQQLTF